MQHTYDIIIRATIEIGGRFTADSRLEAEAQARSELRTQGEISDIQVERSVLLDEPDPADLPPEAYDPQLPY